MTLVATAQKGDILMLQYIVGMVAAGSPVLHLYSNDVTPSSSTVIADLTQCTSPGYAAITLTSASWTTTQVAGVTTAVYSLQTFTFSTDAVAYGYYITDTTNNLLWLERFSGAPYSIPTGGGSVSVGPKITLS